MNAPTTGEPNIWQPTLTSETIRAVPLKEGDFDVLFAAASDPKIWEIHPVPDRYTKPKFEIYFRTGIDSRGAMIVKDNRSGEVIGSSRFYSHDLNSSTVEIGYTFLKCSHWGTGANKELKTLMLSHAFKFVDWVEFFVGAENWRSQAAMKKIGGKIVRTVTEKEPEGDFRKSVVYAISKSEFLKGKVNKP